jgi:hypothetical protein
MPFHLTREQLYDLVWSEAMRTLSQKVGISDVAIAKQCRNHDVPVPERGYWNKVQAGQEVVKPKLPPRDFGTKNSIWMSGHLTPELGARIKGEPGHETGADEDINVLEERFRKRLGKVVVPRGFEPSHPAIAKLLAKDEERRTKYPDSILSSYFGARFNSPFEQRRLRFLNGLLLGFAKVGGSAEVRGDHARELKIYLGDMSISFEVDAVGQATKGRHRSREQGKADQRLYLSVETGHHKVDVPTRWQEEAGAPLEKCITDIIVGLAVASAHLRRKWMAEHTAWLLKQKEEEERRQRELRAAAEKRERERLAAIEKAKRDALVNDARAWQDAALIRQYVAAVLSTNQNAENSEVLGSWSNWALAEAQRIDPLTSGRAEKYAAETTEADVGPGLEMTHI